MKTAISIPDQTFERATRIAAARGMSRSQLVTCAVQAYLDALDAESLVDAINGAVTIPGGDDSNCVAASAGRRRLGADDGDR